MKIKDINQHRDKWVGKSIFITFILVCVSYYFLLPPLNLHSTELIRFLIGWLLIYILIALLCAAKTVQGNSQNESDGEGMSAAARFGGYATFAKRHCKPVLIAVLVCVIIFLVGQISSLPLLRANAYHNLLSVKTGDFAAEVDQIPYSEIPMLDESSARRLGSRKLGELSDMVSQFEISENYTQINVQDRPVRVACLEYGDIFKWFINRTEGLPAYVKVDMVSQEVEIVRMNTTGQSGIRYSPSEYLTRDLNRTLRFRYPAYMFSQPHLEIDEEGAAWWICPRETRTVGLYGGTDILGTVLLNASTGESYYYDINEVPTWVDQVYQASLISEQYNYYGRYVNGFINSLIGQQNVTVTTSGVNYLAMDDDVYMYTGITSINSDQSNIGFLLSNQRTKETVYYAAPGAIEESAMESAQGVVQDLGYLSTFPLLLNIGGEPTYFMSLKDSSDLVKMYAMVNVGQYQLVATGSTVTECEANYIALINRNGIITKNTHELALESAEISGRIVEIRTAILDGTTYYFLRLEGSEVFYTISASQDEGVILLNTGDLVILQTESKEETGAIQEILSLEKEDLGKF